MCVCLCGHVCRIYVFEGECPIENGFSRNILMKIALLEHMTLTKCYCLCCYLYQSCGVGVSKNVLTLTPTSM
jgi:hypothetical protein